MSADGTGIIGAAVLALAAVPVLIAGATIAGAVYGTAKLIEYASNTHQKSEAIRKEQERRRAAELARKNEEERRKINEVISSFNSLQARQTETRNKINLRFASELSLAAREVEENQQTASANMVELLRTFERRSSDLHSEWSKTSEQLQSEYSNSIMTSFSNMKHTIEQGKAVIASLQTEANDDLRKKEYAKKQIETAKAAIMAIEVELGEVTNSFVAELNAAIDYYNQNMFDNAYSKASTITIDCYDYLANALIKREKQYSLLDMIESKVILLNAKIQSLKHFTFDYKQESYEEDLTRFSPEIFAAIADRLSNIEKGLTSSNLAELISFTHDLDEIKTDIDEVTRISATKLLYAYTENDTAADITSAMKSQGFEMEGYAYERDEEGNAIHINYVNSISNEKVTVVLTPSSDGIRVDVHNYGTNSVSGMEDATRQDSIRQLIENTLNIHISCTNRGKSSTNISASNLDEVQRIN